MGTCSTEFIPAAILYRNPGLDIRELAQAYEQANANINRGYAVSEGGLQEIAHDFHLQRATPFEKSRLLPFLRVKVSKNQPSLYCVNEFTGTSLGNRFRIQDQLMPEVKEGDAVYVGKGSNTSRIRITKEDKVFWETLNKTPTYIVDEIHDEENSRYDFTLRPRWENFRRTIHQGLESFLKAHPEREPEKTLDLSQSRGTLSLGCLSKIFNAEWENRNGKYYLDINSIMRNEQSYSFKRDSNTSDTAAQFIYDSIMITATAIDNGIKDAFKFVDADQRDSKFYWLLLKYPSLLTAYMTATKQYWHLQSARNRNLSNTNFMRERLSNPKLVGITEDIIKQEQQIIKDNCQWMINEWFERKKRPKPKRTISSGNPFE